MKEAAEFAHLKGKSFLITGIADEASLALPVAQKLEAGGGQLVVLGLGLTKFHAILSEKAASFLQNTYDAMNSTVQKNLAPDTLTLPVDLSLDDSIAEVCNTLAQKGYKFDGVSILLQWIKLFVPGLPENCWRQVEMNF